jgi:hypothetical protein
MDAVIKVSSSEFDEELFKKIKSLIKKIGNAEVTIAVTNKTENLFRNESKKEYWDRLNKSVTDIEEGKGVVFTMDELEEYIHKLPGR